MLNPSVTDEWQQAGKIGKAHGLKGHFFVSGRPSLFPSCLDEIILKPTQDRQDPSLKTQKPGEETQKRVKVRDIHTTLCETRVVKNRSILKVDCAQDRTAIEALCGMEIWIQEKKDKQELSDLVYERTVFSSDNQVVGRIESVLNYGAGDVVAIHNAHSKKSLELPLNDSFFKLTPEALNEQADKLYLLEEAEALAELWYDYD